MGAITIPAHKVGSIESKSDLITKDRHWLFSNPWNTQNANGLVL